MTQRRETDTAVPLDGLTEGQLAILRHGAAGWLMGMAADLRLVERGMARPKRHLRRTAALGRLARGLEREAVDLPDPLVKEMLAERTTETSYLDELKEKYEQELAEYEAWVALLAVFSDDQGEADG